MDIGRLRHRVILQRLTATADGAGGFTESWAALATVWASIDPATARDLERVFGAELQAPVTHLVTTRYYSGLTPKDRVVFGSRTFAIRGLQNPEERRIAWVMACEELLT
jgi:SPP1 family predicted phage head-tail adaptor